MNFSQNAKHIIDNCRFCWMCHHICPVGNATGQERNTARARALVLSLVNRDAADLTPDIIDNMYECTLCGGCTADCCTGFDPIVFVKEVRAGAALEGKTPDYINVLLDNFDAKGNIYGKDICSCLAEVIAANEKKSDTLFFLGADARYLMCENAKEAIELLKVAGADFTVLANEPDSGYSFDTLVGAVEETRAIMENAAKVLNGYKTVVVYDPADAKTFIRQYKEWGIELSCNIVTYSAYVADLVKAGKFNIKRCDCTLAYQDPALLVRELEETQPARDIIAACADLKDFMLCGKGTMFAGNLIMSTYNKSSMDLIAQQRLAEAVRLGVDGVVCASVSEFALMNENKPEGLKVLTLEQLILSHLA